MTIAEELALHAGHALVSERRLRGRVALRCTACRADLITAELDPKTDYLHFEAPPRKTKKSR